MVKPAIIIYAVGISIGPLAFMAFTDRGWFRAIAAIELAFAIPFFIWLVWT